MIPGREVFYRFLPQINNARITRNINPGNESEEFDLVGFDDASERAYGACLYAVYRNTKRRMKSHLICSKSRVAEDYFVTQTRAQRSAFADETQQ